MPPRTLPRTARLLAVAAVGVVATSLTGCTALAGSSAEPVVVTVTPTVTVMAGAAGPSSSTAAASTSTTLPADLESDDKGKAYDLGRIVGVKEVQGTKVISLDRVRNRSIPSERLFREGMQLEPHSRELFVSGSSQTYSLPVLPGASFTRLTCVSSEAPVRSAASTLEELAGLQGREAVVLVELDDKGWVEKVTSDPVCR